MNDKLISVIDVAINLDRKKQHIFKILKRLGIESIKQTNSNSRGQKIAYITAGDFEKVKEAIAGIENVPSDSLVKMESRGLFYLIQLEPQHDSGRFKVGFAKNIEERLRSHKTSAPYSKVLKTWPCKLLWEKTAIDCVAKGCERLHTEVFRTNSMETVLAHCEEFFRLMPEIRTD